MDEIVDLPFKKRFISWLVAMLLFIGIGIIPAFFFDPPTGWFLGTSQAGRDVDADSPTSLDEILLTPERAFYLHEEDNPLVYRLRENAWVPGSALLKGIGVDMTNLIRFNGFYYSTVDNYNKFLDMIMLLFAAVFPVLLTGSISTWPLLFLKSRKVLVLSVVFPIMLSFFCLLPLSKECSYEFNPATYLSFSAGIFFLAWLLPQRWPPVRLGLLWTLFLYLFLLVSPIRFFEFPLFLLYPLLTGGSLDCC